MNDVKKIKPGNRFFMKLAIRFRKINFTALFFIIVIFLNILLSIVHLIIGGNAFNYLFLALLFIILYGINQILNILKGCVEAIHDIYKCISVFLDVFCKETRSNE